MTQIQNDSVIVVNPYLYIYGLHISNDATTPNTVLDIAAGQCRDVMNYIDMGVGTTFPPGAASTEDSAGAPTVTAPLLLNAATNGANGLDTGSLAASTMYAVYIIGDSRYYNPVASILTLASNSSPLMPLGYDSYRLIGFWATNSSSHFLTGYYSGLGHERFFTYDTPQATSVTTGNATTFTAVALTTLVPPINNINVTIYSNFNANAAADTLSLQGYSFTGTEVLITAPVAGSTAHTTTNSTVLAQLNSAAPTINYKVSSSSDAVALDVVGYTIHV